MKFVQRKTPVSSFFLLQSLVRSKGTSGADKHVGEHAHVGVPRLVPQELEVDLVMVVPHRRCLNLQSIDAHTVSIAVQAH